MTSKDKEEVVIFLSKKGSENFDLEEKQDTPKRGQWDRKCDFILSLIGYSVGVSNLWRFPYLCLRNGGGAFLIPFFIFLFLTGIPLFYLEVCVGQFAGTSPLFVWRLCPLFKGLGWCACIVSGITSIYYVAVIAWILFFFVNAFYPTLPWSSCDNWWNTDTCLEPSSFNYTNASGTTLNMTSLYQDNTSIASYSLANSSHADVKTSAEEFWQYYVLRKSAGLHDVGSLQPHLVACLFVAWFLVFLCLIKGIKSLGKVVYVTAVVPYFLLTVLLIRGIMLPGAIDGIKFYVNPDFSRLTRLSVWVEAAIQVFFSLGPAWGSLITMASFNDFNNNCFRLA